MEKSNKIVGVLPAESGWTFRCGNSMSMRVIGWAIYEDSMVVPIALYPHTPNGAIMDDDTWPDGYLVSPEGNRHG